MHTRLKQTSRLVLSIALAAIGCSTAPPEMQVIDSAAAALGGRETILGVRTLAMEGLAFIANVGQNMSPESEEVGDDLRGFTRTLDFVNGRGRSEFTRAPAFVSPADPYRQIVAVDGDVAFGAGGMFDLKAERMGRTQRLAARERVTEFFLHQPLGVVRAALDPAAEISNLRSEGDSTLVDVMTIRGETVTLETDAAGLPASVTSMIYHPNLGDVALKTAFSDYQEVSGIKLPMRLTSTLDKWPGTDLRLSKYTVNGPAGDLAAPESVRNAPQAPPAVPKITVEPLAPGVWVLGDGYFSMLVELEDHTVLVEVPSEPRALALFAKARELVPNKPLTKVVTTHHHFDHTGGLRAAIAEGLTIVTHERNKAAFEQLAQRKHSLIQDALAKNPRPLKIEPVGDRLVWKDALRTMELYHGAGNPHADTLLVVYLPKEKILMQADMYFPTFFRQPYATNLLEVMAARNMKVDREVSVHGGVQTQAQVEQKIRAGT